MTRYHLADSFSSFETIYNKRFQTRLIYIEVITILVGECSSNRFNLQDQ